MAEFANFPENVVALAREKASELEDFSPSTIVSNDSKLEVQSYGFLFSCNVIPMGRSPKHNLTFRSKPTLTNIKLCPKWIAIRIKLQIDVKLQGSMSLENIRKELPCI